MSALDLLDIQLVSVVTILNDKGSTNEQKMESFKVFESRMENIR